MGDPLRGLPFPDSTFDLVLSSHVAHGLGAADRHTLFREAQRVSRGMVLFHDYPPRSVRRGRPDVRVIETLERGDYRRFVRTGLAEMERVFASVSIVPVGPNTAWYLCRDGRAGSVA